MIELVMQYQSAKVFAAAQVATAASTLTALAFSVLYQVAVLLLRFTTARHSFSYRSYNKKSGQ